MFAHMTFEDRIASKTTVIMPVTQDTIASTNSPYQKHAKISALEFISLLGEDTRSKKYQVISPLLFLVQSLGIAFGLLV
jgi:hypothetical protein